ncbi:MAG: hypothetical protein WAK20_00290 [Candidatus Acidiferrum sp.]
MFYQKASVFDDIQACAVGQIGRRGIFDAQLKPEAFCSYPDGALGHGRNVFGPAKNINHVDFLGNVLYTGVTFLTKNFCFVRIDRNNAIAGALEIFGDRETRPKRVSGQPDNSDRSCFAEYVRDRIS